MPRLTARTTMTDKCKGAGAVVEETHAEAKRRGPMRVQPHLLPLNLAAMLEAVEKRVHMDRKRPRDEEPSLCSKRARSTTPALLSPPPLVRCGECAIRNFQLPREINAPQPSFASCD